MSAISSLAEWLRSLPIPWLSGREVGAADMTAQGNVYDGQVALLKAAVKARMPLEAPADALPYIGQERKLVQGSMELDADFRLRCQDVWGQWALAGMWAEMLFQLHHSCNFDCGSLFIVQQNGLCYQLSANPGPQEDPLPLLVVTQLGLNYNIADLAGYPWWTFDDRDDLTARFAVIVDDGWIPYAFSGGSHVPRSIFGFSDQDVYAVGDSGVISHWDGVSWTSQVITGTPNFTRVYGDSPDSVFATAFGKIFRTTDHGITWDQLTSPSVTNIRGVWAKGNQVWVISITPKVFYSSDNGGTWDAGTSLSTSTMIGGTAVNDLFVPGDAGYEYWDGSTWTNVAYPNPVGGIAVWNCMFGIGDDKWIVGTADSGTPYSGVSRISNSYGTTTEETSALYETFAWVHGSSLDTIYAVAGGTDVLKRNADGVWELFQKDLAPASLNGIWVSPAGTIWVCAGALDSGHAIYSHPALNAGLIAKIVKTWKPAKARYMGLIEVAQGALWGWPVGTQWGQGGLKWGSSTGIRLEP